ncbi:MAG: hypothetical protein AMJ65_14245 [Phycisphaerae bacterium SG8_4]|nr:MAG: hypothetical protein AMJ65_14245 [Phycisphaerae bacterium SG8_4]
MQIKKVPFVLLLVITASVSNVGHAAEAKTEDPNLAELRQEVSELRKQMGEMKAKHESEIQALKNQVSKGDKVEDVNAVDDEVDLLRQLALEAAGGEMEKKEEPAEQTKFTFKGLNLRKLNPEISVSGDLVGKFTTQDDVRRTTDIEMRSWELNIQSYLDPFSKFKSTIPVDSDGNVEIEEMYFTRYNAFGDINLDLGKFRQQFGVINRWHGDALDQIDYPLALQNILGEDGLAQTGFSVDLPLPEMGDATQILTVQITTAENDHLFGGETMGNPSLLFRAKNFRDLDENSYFEFGISGLFGWNDRWEVATGGGGTDQIDDALGTQVVGADFTYVWEPPQTAMYHNVEWRSELYFLNRDIYAPDGSGRDSLDAWGAFTYVQKKVDRNVYVGIRGDYYRADSKPYADAFPTTINPFAYTDSDAFVWQVSPYVTLWQSEYVRFHVEYNYTDGHTIQEPGHTIGLQAVFAAGPHKHERY